MKAWLVRKKDEFCATIVFAETRGKAMDLALYTDACEDADFIDIEVYRKPNLDKYYKAGKTEMEWDNPQDRLILVKECDFCCEEVDLDSCKTCSARDYCCAYEDYTDASAEEVER